MNVLVIGTGGREHCLAWALNKSPSIGKVFVYPGNAGMFLDSKIISLSSKINLTREDLAKLSHDQSISLVVIGPENYLEAGYSDYFRSLGFSVVGPNREAALLETSKAFAKEFMQRHFIKTAPFQVATSFNEASQIINRASRNLVIKADELAQGKGVVVTDSKEDALKAAQDFFLNPQFIVKSKKVVIEERLQGHEISAIALVDGNNYKIIGHARDHKRAFDNNLGPNTGGMGTVIYKNWPSLSLKKQISDIFEKTIQGLKKDKLLFQGFLFLGILVQEETAYLLEYNTRLGDPETQVMLPALVGNLKLDVAKLLFETANGKLGASDRSFEVTDEFVHVVLASENYPDLLGQGMTLNQNVVIPAAEDKSQTEVFYSGVKKDDSDCLKNSGGRILGVTAWAPTISAARLLAYQQIERIKVKGSFYRKDIGEDRS